MKSKKRPRTNKISVKYATLSIFVLLVCLAFNIYHAFLSPHPGFPYDQYWVVTDTVHCIENDADCGQGANSLQVGDRIIQINTLSYENWQSNRYTNPFANYSAGDTVPLIVLRDGETLTIDWRFPELRTHLSFESAIIPFLIYFPIWFVGTVVLLSMSPNDLKWRLLIAITYLTAIWLSVGISSTGLSTIARTSLQALTWLLAAVYLHFHYEVPEPLIKGLQRYVVPLLYVLAFLFMVAEILYLLPIGTYQVAALLAFAGSFGLVAYRAVATPAGPNRVTARIMFAGALLAIGPILLLSLIPPLFDVSPPNLLAIVIPLMAIVVLPFFYFYAIYKRDLGRWEFRINRFLYYYTLFLIIFTILSIVFLVGTRWQDVSNDIVALLLISGAALFLAVVPLHRRFQTFLDRLTYGSEQMPEEIYKKLSTRIPATFDRHHLHRVFDEEIMPNLAVEQSAICLITDGQLDNIYELNIADSERPNHRSELFMLLEQSGKYLSPGTLDEDLDVKFRWVRLAIPVTTRLGTTGAWLFGRRLPDDFYSHYDIELLKSLADQLAVTVENLHLVGQIQEELAERKKAEAQQQQYSERIRLIHQVDRAILSAEFPEEIAQAVISNIPQLIKCDVASVIIFNEVSAEAELIAVLDDADDLKQGTTFQLSEFDFVHNIPFGDSLILDGQFGNWQQSDVATLLRNPRINTGMIVPLVESGTIIGSLILGTSTENAYGEEQRKIALEVGNSLAVALQNARLIDTVKEHRMELQRLYSRLITAQEDERKRISYELHDEIGQLLTAISFNMASVEKALPEGQVLLIRQSLRDTNDLIEQVMEQVRTLSLELRPSMLQDLGLVPTLRWYLNVSAKRLNITTRLKSDGLDQRFDEEIETAIYRIVQEALTNAVRHGQANEIRVNIECKNCVLSLNFEDDGRGFDNEAEPFRTGENMGAGLLGIRERVANLDGKFKIESTLNKGTSIKVVIPVFE